MRVPKKSLGYDENVYYLNCNGDFTGICICQNSCKFVYLLYINYTSTKLLKKILVEICDHIPGWPCGPVPFSEP